MQQLTALLVFFCCAIAVEGCFCTYKAKRQSNDRPKACNQPLRDRPGKFFITYGNVHSLYTYSVASDSGS